MKKSLLALAVLGAFAGAASAQSNITVYGIADVGVNWDNGKTATVAGGSGHQIWALRSGQQSGSRIGFRGTEDLGGGLAAVFTLESSINLDDGTTGNSFPNSGTTSGAGRLFGRQAWVGLQGGFGAVKLGRQYSTIYNAQNAIDPFGINQAGDMQRVYGYGLGKVDPISRSDNTITYTTPDFAGFSGQAGYGFGEQAGAFSNNSNAFAGLAYVAGPVNVQLAYQRAFGVPLGATGTGGANSIATAVASTGGGFPTSGTGLTLGGTGAVNPDVKTAFLGATYDFAVVKAHLGFGDTKVEAGPASTKIRNYLVGVSAPVASVGSVYASWNRNDFRELSAGKSNQYAVGYSHSLSKRTNLYTSFGYTKNDAAVRLNAFANGQSDREFQAGVRHSF